MMLEAALAYASQGFHVFPILPGLKKPLTKHGFKEATTDTEQIRAWWGANPTANIGCWWDPSGMCAVDLDIGAPMGLDLPLTMMVKTPSGGRHFIYQGRMPDTQQKLAPHVDTRGIGGYTILPPSVFEGRPYEWLNDGWAQPLPRWIVEFFATAKPDPRHTKKRIDEIDTEERIAAVREIAAWWPPATEYAGSNDATIELANRLLDLCSHHVVFEAMAELWMPRCIGDWTDQWLFQKVFSIKVGSGRDSDIGCEEYPIEYGYKPERDKGARRARFAGILFRDFKNDEPEYWDPKTKLIPRNAVTLIYGQPSAHKTNLTLTLLFDILGEGAKIVYAAGEGANNVLGKRGPAHASSRGIDLNLIDRFLTVPAVPLLQNGGEVHEFIEEHRDFNPDIVVIDTLATATAGLDENSSAFSALLTDNGAVGKIRRELRCTLIIVTHEGKDAGRGVRGHSGQRGNVDATIQVTCTGLNIKAHVMKMRDGPDNRSVFAKVTYVEGIPVPVWCDAPPKTPDDEIWVVWYHALKALGAVDKKTAVTINQTTEKMLSMHPHLAKTQDALRQRLNKSEERLKGYEAGRGKAGAWLYAIFTEEN